MSIVHSITHIILFLMSCLVWCGFSSLTTQFWTLYNIILYGLFPTSTSTHEGSVHTLPFPPQSYTPWHSSCLYSINSPIAYFVIHQQRHSGTLFGVLLFFLAPGITSRSQFKNPLSGGFAVTLQFSFSHVCILAHVIPYFAIFLSF